MEPTKSKLRFWGPILWILSIQYYIAQFLTAADWTHINGYSWSNNTISDLANTHCGLYGLKNICSPEHTLMNASFIILGLTMIGGAYLLKKLLAEKKLSDIGFGLMAIAGVGTIIVGFYPENTISLLHIFGAGLTFVLGNLGMIVLGKSLKSLPNMLRYYSIISGFVGLVALAFFISNHFIGIGIGGMERFISYPQSLWMIIIGAYYFWRLRLR